MKIKRLLVSAFLLLAFLFVGCNQTPPPEGGDVVYPTETMEKVLTFDGVTARLTEFGGIIARYSVDAASVASLEKEGYSVAYGVVAALSSQENATLSVSGDASEGYKSPAPASATAVAYATASPAYLSAVAYVDGFPDYAVADLTVEDGSVAFTTAYKSASAEGYKAELVSIGFVAVTDRDGNQSIVYDRDENKASMLSLADSLVNGYVGDVISTYYYNQNETLRGVLNSCGKEARDLEAPVTVSCGTGEAILSKPLSEKYVAAAREAYRTAAYADYTTSVVGDYTTTASMLNDIPVSKKLFWKLHGEGKVTYTVMVATDEAFTQNLRTYETDDTVIEVYNLLTDTTYYFKVIATTADGYIYESASATFKTAPSVRWIYIDGVRNVRDIGGWNGLNQGLVYRGSELNKTQSYGTAITEEGIRAMREELLIKTHLDFRPAASNGQFGTSSPIGEGVKWENHAISAFLGFTGSGYASAMKVFADYDNYPVYMNCVGGADRTGTAAFMLEGLCGVHEADLSVDLELTSFSKFGYRYRYNNTTYVYADLVARVKEYSGNTLQEKFETIFRDVYGFSVAEISNVQAILTQNGAVYDFKSYDDNGDVTAWDLADGSFAFSFIMRESTAVTSVSVDGIELDFTFDAETATVTVDGEPLRSTPLATGIGTITFDDGATLRFYVV